MVANNTKNRVIKSYNDFLEIYLPNRKAEIENQGKEESFGEILARELLRDVSKQLSES